MEGLKVIFLDFDGVITCHNSKWSLMPDKMNMIRRICETTGAKIVISSSWRMNTLESTLAYITDPKTPYVDGKPYSLSDFTIDVTCSLWDREKYGRGDEIQAWLDFHPDVTNYVILDDDVFDMLPCQEGHIIETSWESGIGEEDVETAIKILSEKKWKRS